MKKHDVKPGRTKPPEVRTREQVENETFNRMLLWLAVAAVVEVIMVLINRFYINARVSELEAKIALYYVLAAFPFVGAALFVILLALGIRRWKSGQKMPHEAEFCLPCPYRYVIIFTAGNDKKLTI